MAPLDPQGEAVEISSIGADLAALSLEKTDQKSSILECAQEMRDRIVGFVLGDDIELQACIIRGRKCLAILTPSEAAQTVPLRTPADALSLRLTCSALKVTADDYLLRKATFQFRDAAPLTAALSTEHNKFHLVTKLDIALEDELTELLAMPYQARKLNLPSQEQSQLVQDISTGLASLTETDKRLQSVSWTYRGYLMAGPDQSPCVARRRGGALDLQRAVHTYLSSMVKLRERSVFGLKMGKKTDFYYVRS